MQENKTTAIVLAEKIQEMKQAERNYLRKLRAAPDVRKTAYEDYQKISDEAENIAYAVLHPLTSSSSRNRSERAAARFS